MKIAAYLIEKIGSTVSGYFHPSLWLSESHGLLVSERLDRIEQRRLARRVVSEKNANRNGKERRDDNRFEGHDHRPLQRLANQIGAKNSEHYSGAAANEAQHHGLAQKLQLNGLFRRSDGNTNANLPRAFSHGNQHDIHDANPAHNQRDGSDGNQQNRERLAGFELRLNDVFRVADVEVIVFFRAQMVAVAQERRGFLPRNLHRILGNRRTQNVIEPGDPLDFFHGRRIRQDDRVVLVLTGKGQALGHQRSHHFAGQILHANHFADRILNAEQLVTNGAANDADVRRALHGISTHTCFGAMSTGANAVYSPHARLNPHKIVAEVIELLFDTRLAGLANSHHANHGSDADGDAQHRQDAAHLIAHQRHNG